MDKKTLRGIIQEKIKNFRKQREKIKKKVIYEKLLKMKHLKMQIVLHLQFLLEQK